ncbi:hypothetical protein R1sor_017563 [Riccia sorocarpa]|uniref:Importin N-terminal domain-containing protein n=1 Tax=Riccia sorocarpa TaxID=122646 RepID=A0ABD3I8A5_9MARC
MENSGNSEAGQLVWLTNVLKATLDTNPGIRLAAENALKDASVHPVLLKQYVKIHWQEGEKDFAAPQVPAQDKVAIRALLPQALEDPHGKIRTAVGMAIATIANSDWPEEWPDLMNYLLGFISDRSDLNRVHGALRCLALFAGDLDDTLLPPLVPVLFPALYQIVSSPNVSS